MGKDKRPTGAAGRALEQGVKHPKKRLYRARAHSNPLNDQNFDTPAHPDDYDWSLHYPAFFPEGGIDSPASTRATVQPSRSAEEGAASSGAQPQAAADGGSDSISAPKEAPMVRFADVGCGFGGLLVKLAPLFPDTLILGLELRDKVSEYVKERVLAMRRERPGLYDNISCMRTNAQKYLVHYFRKGQLTKLFFLFPDPHFKAATHRRRIISAAQLADYAYVLAPGGMLYTITDVPELGAWMRDKADAHPLFGRVSDEEVGDDLAARMIGKATEEGQKVERNTGLTFRAVYRRLHQPKEA